MEPCSTTDSIMIEEGFDNDDDDDLEMGHWQLVHRLQL